MAVSILYDDGEDAARAIADGLRDFNREAAGAAADPPHVNVALRDETGKVRGGAVARLWFDAVYLELVWIDAALRRCGHGRTIVTMVESKARGLGARCAWLNTLDWQARAFYERLGYRVFGEFAFMDGARHRYFMLKDL